MQTITFDSTYFNPKDVLECGQIFRFQPFKEGYTVYSRDKACYVRTDGKTTFIESDDPDYFYSFFDLGREYALIVEKMKEFNVPVLTRSAEASQGLRLLNQDPEEMIFSFIVSQNNNIPRIKKIISRMCAELGEKRSFMGEEYYAFPTAAAMAEKSADFYKAIGAGYRAAFLYETAVRIAAEGVEKLKNLPYAELRKVLLGYKGIGPKVADCIALFGFKKTECFPVDTWIEKLYKEDFNGTLTDRNEIGDYFCGMFGEYSGYVQQYLFYAKRENL